MKRKKKSKPTAAKRPPPCPECKSLEVVPVLHGPITPELEKSIANGEAVLASREEWEGMTEWYCKSCGCDWSGEWRRFKRPDPVLSRTNERKK